MPALSIVGTSLDNLQAQHKGMCVYMYVCIYVCINVWMYACMNSTENSATSMATASLSARPTKAETLRATAEVRLGLDFALRINTLNTLVFE